MVNLTQGISRAGKYDTEKQETTLEEDRENQQQTLTLKREPPAQEPRLIYRIQPSKK